MTKEPVAGVLIKEGNLCGDTQRRRHHVRNTSAQGQALLRVLAETRGMVYPPVGAQDCKEPQKVLGERQAGAPREQIHVCLEWRQSNFYDCCPKSLNMWYFVMMDAEN